MVNEARAEAAQSEKLYREAHGKNEVLQAEVKALKELVLTSTPSAPNKHLHPQLSVVNGNTSNSSTSLGHQRSGGGGHSRQSSLNQQSFNNIVQNLSSNNNSNNGSNSNLSINGSSNPISLQVPASSRLPGTSVSSTVILSSSVGNGANNSAPRLSHSSTSVQPLSSVLSKQQQQQHRRAPSQNDIKPSFIDKLFHTSSSSSIKQKQEEFNTVSNQVPDVHVVDIADVCLNQLINNSNL
jgi:hypothetical protein